MAPVDEDNVRKISDPSAFQSSLGEGRHFHGWEAFFQREIDNHGGQAVLQKHLLSRTPNAEALLVRTYGGLLHLLIHFGLRVEFSQPAITVKALAQATVHQDWIGPYLLEADKRAHSSSKSSQEGKSIVSLLKAIYEDPALAVAADLSDDNKIRDRILVRAPEKMLDIASRYHLPRDIDSLTLSEATVEMIKANVYFTACSQFANKKPESDFYFMHCINCFIFFLPSSIHSTIHG